MAKDTAERQRAFAEKRQAEGTKARKMWVTDADFQALLKRYPGPKGGVDWQAVIDYALRKPVTVQVQISSERGGAWQPQPWPKKELQQGKEDAAKRDDDRRCAAATVRGGRCRKAGELIALWQSPDGVIGEFVACQQHHAEFEPHPSVLAKSSR